jgi:hypothetical protein
MERARLEKERRGRKEKRKRIFMEGGAFNNL